MIDDKGPSQVPEGQCEAHYPYASPGCPTCGDAPVMLRGHDWTEADEKGSCVMGHPATHHCSYCSPKGSS